MNILNKLSANKKELILVLGILIISGLAHGYGMFRFPYYENDEGTYMSQAWAIVREGRLAPYTYWYDHAPAGWMLIALWTKLTGGFFAFGLSVNSGRVLMLVLHVISTGLLYYITRRLSRSTLAGVTACMIFALSPLGIYFQRRVLLDNIMIFWVLAAVALLVRSNLKLSGVVLSSCAFGVAVLTKENAAFFVPAFLYAVTTRAHQHHRRFSVILWLAVAGSLVSLYLLSALLKGEFFPVGFMGNAQPHVSLVETLMLQLSRGSGYPFWDARSDFYTTLATWLRRDAFTLIAGAASTMALVVLCVRDKSLRLAAWLGILFWLFLLRGKLVIDFYIIPLIPLLALSIGVVTAKIVELLLPRFRRSYIVAACAVPLFVAVWYLSHPLGQYTHDETANQVQAVEWIKAHVPPHAHVAVDAYALVDFWDERFPGDVKLPYADWFWKIDTDPEIRDVQYHNDWKRMAYVALTHEMLKQIREGKLTLLRDALEHAEPLQEWQSGSTSYFDMENYISTNGDWAALWRVQDSYDAALGTSWNYYKAHFIRSYGQVVDASAGREITTSEGQAYAMLRAVWMGDKIAFDGVWAWTRDHLQFRSQDRLFSWRWEKDPASGDERVIDPASAADADEDIALALLFAARRWKADSYRMAAEQIIRDIWRQEVREINGRLYLTAGTDAWRDTGFLINPSYLSPASYRIFAEVDGEHPWRRLADDSYTFLDELSAGGDAGMVMLPTDWVLVRHDGTLDFSSLYLPAEADVYGYDAFRVYWRLALDAAWFQNPHAKRHLSAVTPLFRREWEEKHSFAARYDRAGRRIDSTGSISTDAGVLAASVVADFPLSGAVYTVLFDQKFNGKEGHWGDPRNYYDQNWAWLGTALYVGNSPDLWNALPSLRDTN